MKTITVQIGNTDNKLTQQLWSKYVLDVKSLFNDYNIKIYFFGASETYAPWQNVCWVFECPNYLINTITDSLVEIRKQYNQESIAIQVGDIELI